MGFRKKNKVDNFQKQGIESKKRGCLTNDS